jgi:hypothetical protein
MFMGLLRDPAHGYGVLLFSGKKWTLGALGACANLLGTSCMMANRIRASVEDIKLTVDKHERTLQCVTDHFKALICLQQNSYAYTSPPRWDHASSMMSLREIQLARRTDYQEGGDCGLAAAEAWELFDRAHKLMHPKLVDGVLFAASSGKAVIGKPGISPAQPAGVSQAMKPFKLLERGTEGCIWVPDESLGTVMNVNGMSHRVALVTTLEGERVVVDWGTGQFSSAR